jgi:hypothetical protein
MRNRIINGDMRIDQRNNGASVAVGSGGPYTVDRFPVYKDTASLGLSAQRVTDAPAGFTNSLRLTVTSPVSPAVGEANTAAQVIEGFNVSDLAWGTANAQTITISFWVKCSAAGTFGGGVVNEGYNRSRTFSYTITSANTWEYKTVTIPGDTGGGWATTNGAGLRLYLSIGAGANISAAPGSWIAGVFVSATGATSITNTNGATFQITGVQLEAGSVATPFERRPYGTELTLCLRYYENAIISSGQSIYQMENFTESLVRVSGLWAVEKRASPTITGLNVSSPHPRGYSVVFGTSIGTGGFRVDTLSAEL